MSGIQDRAAWTGATIDYRADGLHTLSAAEVEEIDAALAHLRSCGDLDFPARVPTADPASTMDFEAGPGWKWGYGLLLNSEDVPGARRPAHR